MRKQETGEQANQAAFGSIPTTRHILDNYNVLTTEEKTLVEAGSEKSDGIQNTGG